MRVDEAIVNDEALFARIYGDQYGEQHLADAGKLTQDVIDCTTDICNYIYDTHGRLPAHVEAIHVPGIWLQVHHVEERYCDSSSATGSLRCTAAVTPPGAGCRDVCGI